jgi:hypothetical protein
MVEDRDSSEFRNEKEGEGGVWSPRPSAWRVPGDDSMSPAVQPKIVRSRLPEGESQPGRICSLRRCSQGAQIDDVGMYLVPIFGPIWNRCHPGVTHRKGQDPVPNISSGSAAAPLLLDLGEDGGIWAQDTDDAFLPGTYDLRLNALFEQ